MILSPSLVLVAGLLATNNGMDKKVDIECGICGKYGLVGPRNSVCETCNNENPDMEIEFREREGVNHCSVFLYDIFSGSDSSLNSEEEAPNLSQAINTGQYIEHDSHEFGTIRNSLDLFLGDQSTWLDMNNTKLSKYEKQVSSIAMQGIIRVIHNSGREEVANDPEYDSLSP
jgi:hypothetical protein